MAASSDFFGQRSPQAVFKHGVLARYAHYFAGRAGSATGGKVAFIDGYAGEGRYEDGSPGSPLLLATQAERAKVFKREVRLAFVETDAERRNKLSTSLADAGVEADQLLGSTFDASVDALLDRYADHAVLLFVDPFGLAISRVTLERILQRSTRRQPIDVLYHFSLSTVSRMARAAVVDSRASLGMSAQLDSALGGVDWRQDFTAATNPGEPTAAGIDVAERFRRSVRAATRVAATTVPVHRRPGELPAYLLMLFSADDRAHWDFADQAGNAHVDWLLRCSRDDYAANVRNDEATGALHLFDHPAPTQSVIDEALIGKATAYLPGHLAALLRERGSIRPVDDVEACYGAMLGRARATHVRAAMKQLHERGVTDDDAKGDFWLREIRFTGSR
jgi:three-Cys-motif partner protein